MTITCYCGKEWLSLSPYTWKIQCQCYRPQLAELLPTIGYHLVHDTVVRMIPVVCE